MIANDVVELCKKHGIDANSLRIAGAVELMAGKIDEKSTLESVADTLVGLLHGPNLVNAVKWAAWVQNAKNLKLNGKNYDELLKLRTEK